MNTQHMLIDNAFRIEINSENNHFTTEQKKELLYLLEKFRKIKPTYLI